MMFFELRRGASTLHCKAACDVLVIFGGRNLNLRRPTSSEKGVCVYHPPTLHFVQRGEWCRRIFRSFPKEKRFPFLLGLFQRKRDFLSYMVVCSPSLWSVGTLPVSSPLAAPFICHWQRSHPKPREPVGRSPKTKKTPCLCMMFFELRRQDLKNTPYASVRGPRYTSFCMRHLRHNKKRHLKRCLFC